VQTLLTPYLEIRQMLEDLAPAPGSTLVDLGAGYGRIGFVVARHFPEVNFIGYEFVKERVDEGTRCLAIQGATRARLLQADLFSKSFVLPRAKFYFLYDYGSREAIEQTLNALKEAARAHPITVIGRGRLTRDLIEREHPWLSQVNPPRHRGNYSIYCS
jgi:precorrin-6B methylase 2